jgi:hypothetical protein
MRSFRPTRERWVMHGCYVYRVVFSLRYPRCEYACYGVFFVLCDSILTPSLELFSLIGNYNIKTMNMQAAGSV